MAADRYGVNEQTVAQYTGKLVDETQAAIPGDSLTAFTLTLYDDNTGTILNGRNQQNILNTNGVVIDSSGNLFWTLSPADNIIVGSGEYESHTALFKWTWSGGTKFGYYEINIEVKNLRMVT